MLGESGESAWVSEFGLLRGLEGGSGIEIEVTVTSVLAGKYSFDVLITEGCSQVVACVWTLK